MAGLKQLSQKWLILSKRDRLLLFLVGLFAILGLTDTYLTDPIRQEIALKQAEIAQFDQDVAKIKLNLAEVKAGLTGAASPIQKQIEAVNADIALQDKKLADIGKIMVSPKEILPVLKKLLAQHKDVSVLAMETMAPTGFVKKHVGQNAEISSSSTPTLYQHTIKLRLSGNYLALGRYVADLKKLGQTIAWETAELNASYPENELTLEIYTLSNQLVWMGI